MTIRKILATAALGAAFVCAPLAVQADSLKVGMLSCKVDAGLGLVVMSKKTMNCLFSSDGGRSELYAGSIEKFGVALGKTDAGVLEWAVFAPAAGPPKGALAGGYVGGGASVTLGVGVGANALIGGLGRSIALQPVSIQAQTGLDLSGGVTALTLTAVR